MPIVAADDVVSRLRRRRVRIDDPEIPAAVGQRLVNDVAAVRRPPAVLRRATREASSAAASLLPVPGDLSMETTATVDLRRAVAVVTATARRRAVRRPVGAAHLRIAAEPALVERTHLAAVGAHDMREFAASVDDVERDPIPCGEGRGRSSLPAAVVSLTRLLSGTRRRARCRSCRDGPIRRRCCGRPRTSGRADRARSPDVSWIPDFRSVTGWCGQRNTPEVARALFFDREDLLAVRRQRERRRSQRRRELARRLRPARRRDRSPAPRGQPARRDSR